MQCDVLVIGGGPAGASAAAWLAHGGRDVLLVEREAEARDKVCGEFLSIEACTYLADLGIDLRSLGAVEVQQVRLAHGRHTTTAELPFRACSLSRRVMDEAVLQQAERYGTRVLRGVQVERLDGLRAKLEDGRIIEAKQVFLATGKHDLRGRPRPTGVQGDLIAFKMHWRLQPEQQAALRGFVELVLFADGYGGLEPIQDGLANLCVVVRQKRKERWETLLQRMQNECELLRRRLHGAEPIWEKPLAISHIPYGFVRQERSDVWCLGDQAAVIPSFAGDGMAMALHSGRLAAETYLAGGRATTFQERLAEDVAAQVKRATWVSQFLVSFPGIAMGVAQAWPGVMQTLARGTRIPAGRLVVPLMNQTVET